MKKDPHGYFELYSRLKQFESELGNLGLMDASNAMRDASKFYNTGLPSDFLDAAFLALKQVLCQHKEELPKELIKRLKRTIKDIKAGSNIIRQLFG